MSEPSETGRLEERLSTALRTHGASIEPSNDAYARLVDAVSESPASRFAGAVRPWQPWRRSMGFVAATVVAAGLGAYVISLQPDQLVDTVNAAPANSDLSDLVPSGDDDSGLRAGRTNNEEEPGSSSIDSRAADSVQSPPDSSARSSADAAGEGGRVGSDPLRRFDGLTYAPIRLTRQEAAEAFLDLIGVNDAELEEAGDEVRVRAVGEQGGAGPVVSVLSLDAIGGGYMVTEARSGGIEFEVENRLSSDPTDDDIDDSIAVEATIDLSGRRAGSGSTVEVDLRSVVDGRRVSVVAHPVDERAESAEFDLSVPVTGVDRVWVVMRSADAPSPDDEPRRTAPFAARPVLYLGDPDPSVYTVVRLPPNDPDRGLVLRQAPNGERLGVIELGANGVRRRAVAARRVRGLSWWPVTTPDGTEGWVASRYLAANDPGPDRALLDLARDFMAMVESDGVIGADGRGVQAENPLLVGSITQPLPVVVGPLGSLADFFDADRWGKAEVFVAQDYSQPGAAPAARAYFGDLPSVVIRSPNPTTGGWERVHLFVSRRGGDQSLVGVVRELEPVPPGDDES